MFESTGVKVAVLSESESMQRAASLAAQLRLPLIQTLSAQLPADCVALLQFCAGRLQLQPVDAKQSGPVFVDFTGGANAYRLQGGAELIVKAVRGRSKENLRVLDATAGLGRDSLVLASRGFQVDMLERSPIVAALLADGLERGANSVDARLEQIVSLMTLHNTDALIYLRKLKENDRPDVIYLDPMFPPTEKSALVKKEMRLFQQLFHGLDERYDELLILAKNCARLRVVVKRPRKAEALAGQTPNYALEGKSVRFDVYTATA
jgi:16S rRNA (guanine1516-N2)-methyltransferase